MDVLKKKIGHIVNKWILIYKAIALHMHHDFLREEMNV